MQRTVILGSGGHAKVVVELLREAGTYHPVGCVAPSQPDHESLPGVPWLGDDDCLAELRGDGIRYAFVALGQNQLRRRLIQHVLDVGFELANAVSAFASISPTAHIGRGVAIMPQANIGPATRVDDGVILNSGASVDHDGCLENCCHVGPGATLAGRVRIGETAFVATGASVIPGISIGMGSLIGAGAVVVRDLPEGVVAYGCPARIQRPVGQMPAATEDALPVEASEPPNAFRLVV